MILCLATIALTGMPGTARADLAAWWAFEDDLQDGSGNANHGVGSGSLAYSSDTPAGSSSSKSLQLDGNATSVAIAAPAGLDSTQFTLAYFVNPAGADQIGGFERITARGGSAFETALSGSGSALGQNRLSYYAPGAGWQSPPGGIVAANAWTHVAWRNSNSGATGMELFIDGVSVYTGQGVPAPSGTQFIGSRAGAEETYEGLLDDVLIWDDSSGPLSDADILTIAQSGVSNFLTSSNPDLARKSVITPQGNSITAASPAGITRADVATADQFPDYIDPQVLPDDAILLVGPDESPKSFTFEFSESLDLECYPIPIDAGGLRIRAHDGSAAAEFLELSVRQVGEELEIQQAGKRRGNELYFKDLNCTPPGRGTVDPDDLPLNLAIEAPVSLTGIHVSGDGSLVIEFLSELPRDPRTGASELSAPRYQIESRFAQPPTEPLTKLDVALNSASGLAIISQSKPPKIAVPGGTELAGPAGLSGQYWDLDPGAVPVDGDPILRIWDSVGANTGWADANVVGTTPTGTFIATQFSYGGPDRNDMLEWLRDDAASYAGTDLHVQSGIAYCVFAGFLYVDAPGAKNFSVHTAGQCVVYIGGDLVVSTESHSEPETAEASHHFARGGCYYPVELRWFHQGAVPGEAPRDTSLIVTGFGSAVQSIRNPVDVAQPRLVTDAATQSLQLDWREHPNLFLQESTGLSEWETLPAATPPHPVEPDTAQAFYRLVGPAPSLPNTCCRNLLELYALPSVGAKSVTLTSPGAAKLLMALADDAIYAQSSDYANNSVTWTDAQSNTLSGVPLQGIFHIWTAGPAAMNQTLQIDWRDAAGDIVSSNVVYVGCPRDEALEDPGLTSDMFAATQGNGSICTGAYVISSPASLIPMDPAEVEVDVDLGAPSHLGNLQFRVPDDSVIYPVQCIPDEVFEFSVEDHNGKETTFTGTQSGLVTVARDNSGDLIVQFPADTPDGIYHLDYELTATPCGAPGAVGDGDFDWATFRIQRPVGEIRCGKDCTGLKYTFTAVDVSVAQGLPIFYWELADAGNKLIAATFGSSFMETLVDGESYTVTLEITDQSGLSTVIEKSFTANTNLEPDFDWSYDGCPTGADLAVQFFNKSLPADCPHPIEWEWYRINNDTSETLLATGVAPLVPVTVNSLTLGINNVKLVMRIPDLSKVAEITKDVTVSLINENSITVQASACPSGEIAWSVTGGVPFGGSQSWRFPGSGVPAFSEAETQLVEYPAAGLKEAQLTVWNAHGGYCTTTATANSLAPSICEPRYKKRGKGNEVNLLYRPNRTALFRIKWKFKNIAPRGQLVVKTKVQRRTYVLGWVRYRVHEVTAAADGLFYDDNLQTVCPCDLAKAVNESDERTSRAKAKLRNRFPFSTWMSKGSVTATHTFTFDANFTTPSDGEIELHCD